MLTLPDHETHTHCLYGLTCEQYEELLADSRRNCQLCGEESARKLVIDHDHAVGQWAVRGLLCDRCNGMLRYDKADPHWATAYLTDPWWARMLRDRGIHADMAEPDGTRVLDFFGRLWLRRADGWYVGAYKSQVIPWPELLRKYGPHNLKPFDIPSLPPLASISRSMREGVHDRHA